MAKRPLSNGLTGPFDKDSYALRLVGPPVAASTINEDEERIAASQAPAPYP